MLTVDLRCTRCHKTFPANLDVYRSLNYDTLPKRCPACSDEIQGRPDIVLDRQTLYEVVCRVDGSFARLFARATEFRPLPTDDPSRRLTVKGSDYGASWSGRIDIFSHVWPVKTGAVVTLSYNQVRRRTWYVEKKIQTCGFRGYVVGRTTSRRVPPNYIPADGESEVKEREEENTYVLLTQTLYSTSSALQRDNMPVLMWLEAYSKTTLKGFGRQFHRRIEGVPLWHLDVSGGVRSGRLGTHAMLAVCDPLDPVKVTGTDD